MGGRVNIETDILVRTLLAGGWKGERG